ncbi:MAG: hypothetical protein V3U86_05120, partial [Acidobacteriota bacterium]
KRRPDRLRPKTPMFREFIASLTRVRPADAESFAALFSPSTLLISFSWSSIHTPQNRGSPDLRSAMIGVMLGK